MHQTAPCASVTPKVHVRVPLDVVVTYVRQVANALQCAHDQRLIHRDVKPENMLIGAQNQVLLCDFGIATIAHGTSSQSIEMSMAGTIPYMAPEQIQGRPNRASDQYSLGVVVYEWLCGDRPFYGTPTEVAIQHATQPPPPLREKVPTISLDWCLTPHWKAFRGSTLKGRENEPLLRSPTISKKRQSCGKQAQN